MQGRVDGRALSRGIKLVLGTTVSLYNMELAEWRGKSINCRYIKSMQFWAESLSPPISWQRHLQFIWPHLEQSRSVCLVASAHTVV